MAGGKPGNQNAAKSRIFHDALRRVVLAGDGKLLRKAAEALLRAAADGDIPAIRELRDTLDGKPIQAIAGPDGGPIELHAIERVVVKAPDPGR